MNKEEKEPVVHWVFSFPYVQNFCQKFWNIIQWTHWMSHLTLLQHHLDRMPPTSLLVVSFIIICANNFWWWRKLQSIPVCTFFVDCVPRSIDWLLRFWKGGTFVAAKTCCCSSSMPWRGGMYAEGGHTNPVVVWYSLCMMELVQSYMGQKVSLIDINFCEHVQVGSILHTNTACIIRAQKYLLMHVLIVCQVVVVLEKKSFTN